MKFEFRYDPRIDIEIPVLHVPFEEWQPEDIDSFYAKSQTITAKIPAKILELDKIYMDKYEQLANDPDSFFEIMDELTEISYKISELNVWFLRMEGRFLQAGGHF